jgi:hypothetical protein
MKGWDLRPRTLDLSPRTSGVGRQPSEPCHPERRSLPRRISAILGSADAFTTTIAVRTTVEERPFRAALSGKNRNWALAPEGRAVIVNIVGAVTILLCIANTQAQTSSAQLHRKFDPGRGCVLAKNVEVPNPFVQRSEPSERATSTMSMNYSAMHIDYFANKAPRSQESGLFASTTYLFDLDPSPSGWHVICGLHNEAWGDHNTTIHWN